MHRAKPDRLVFDTISGLGFLAGDPLHHRRQVQTLRRHLREAQSTALILDEGVGSESMPDQIHILAHGVIALDHLHREYGGARRRLRIRKLRGVASVDTYHDLRLLRDGMRVFPKYLPERRPSAARGRYTNPGKTCSSAAMGRWTRSLEAGSNAATVC